MVNRVCVCSIICTLAAVLAVPFSTRAQSPATPDTSAAIPTVTNQRSFSVEGRLISLSPDGRFLAAVDEEADTLCSYETADPTQPHVCADLDAAGVQSIYIEDAAWSPDGSRLAFNEPGPIFFIDADIWVFDANSGAILDLTDDGVERGLNLLVNEADQEPFFMDYLPTWSPDGTEIAFVRSGWRDSIWHGTHLMRVPSDGSGQASDIVEVTPDVPMVVYFDAAWSPNAHTLYYTVSQPQTDTPENGIWAVDVASGQAQQLAITDDPEIGLPTVFAVSPTGDRLLVFYPMAAASNLLTGSAFGLLDLTTGDLVPLRILTDDPTEIAFPGSATFSPDGDWLLYSDRGAITATQLYLRLVDSEDESVLLTSISEEARSAYNLSWATDGTVLVQEGPQSGQLLTIEGANQPPTATLATPSAEPVVTTALDSASGGPVDPFTVEMGTALIVNDAVVTLRSAPSPNAPIAGQVEQGAALTALGPSVAADGYTWIPVIDDATGTIGYIRAEFVSSAND